ncbi:MAG: VCBS repeat-containing protein [Planctomycetota bacterium]
MDYDGDGDLDIVTGSYTGQFYLFRRRPDGFAQRELFTDETGATLMMPFDHVYSVVPELVDMDADGDLDLVVGARSAPVQIVTNIGTRTAPVWSSARTELTTKDGEKIAGSNAHHADWDGDGVRDLIVGSEGGEVRWFRNCGADDAPRYEKGAVLVAAMGGGYEPEGTVPKHPGMRVKVHVTDWNGDGRADLLVGDVTWQQSNPNPLTAAEEREKAQLEQEGRELGKERAAAKDPAARQALDKAIAENRTRLRPFHRTKLHTHGFVWLYLRKAGAAGSPAPAAAKRSK